MKIKAIALALSLSSCSELGFKYSAVSASDVVEEMLISETRRIASAASKNVRGEITEKISPSQCPPGQEAPVAWYLAGVAWYYRPQVKRFVSIDPAPYRETATNVSGHEVCHAVTGPQHDLRHWECMNRYAFPTYPRPGVSGVWSGFAYTSIRMDHGSFEGIQ